VGGGLKLALDMSKCLRIVLHSVAIQKCHKFLYQITFHYGSHLPNVEFQDPAPHTLTKTTKRNRFLWIKSCTFVLVFIRILLSFFHVFIQVAHFL
jgi:hypothetical protein